MEYGDEMIEQDFSVLANKLDREILKKLSILENCPIIIPNHRNKIKNKIIIETEKLIIL